MGFRDWSRGKMSDLSDTYKQKSSNFGAMEAAVFGSEDQSLPIDKVRYVVIDSELTGLDAKKDSIVSLGAIRMVGTRILLGETFDKLISPETELTGSSVVIHGITPGEVAEKPSIEEVLPEFLSFCGDDIMVGYMPAIDLTFLNRETKRLYGVSVKNPVLDVFALDKWRRQRIGEDSSGCPSLYDIAKSLDVPAKGAHNAMADAFITAQVLQRLLPVLIDLGIKSVGELLAVSNPAKGGDKFRFSFKFGNF